MANQYPNVNPGELVPGGTTYAFNARVVGDDLYIRDANGNIIPGRQVDNGDSIVVLDVGYTKQLVLVQYPSLEGIRQGYVTNATNIIQYINQGQWKNDSTSETVYDQNDSVIGSLDPYEVATPLFRVNGKTNVVYNTGKGANTKSGYVVYEGGVAQNPPGGIAPGSLVPGNEFTYGTNAQVIGDDLYIRDANGTIIPGRQVDNGDNISVLDVGYTKQLALVQYPSPDGIRQGYVTNVPSIIKYYKQGQWHNGSTAEEVLDENGSHLGSLDPYEAATPLYSKNGLTHVVYNTDKGQNTKSGYVRYAGSSSGSITIPDISVPGVEKITYGESGQGRPLTAHKIGNGTNALVMVCAVHGYEDNWDKDGIELVNIGNDLISALASSGTNGWSVYIIPCANPDGLSEGYTNNGPGRCTVVGGVDINRDFPIGFTPYGTPRYWTNSTPLSVPESTNLSEFIQGVKNDTFGEMVVIDLHGWQGAAIGNPEIGQYFINQFGFGQRSGYGNGYMIAWANSIGAKAALIELPQNTYSHADVVNNGYSQKVINAVTNLIDANEGDSNLSILDLLQELTQHALAYLGQESVTMDNAGNVNACILDYLRQYKYANVMWTLVLGGLSGFVDYMNTNFVNFNKKIFKYICSSVSEFEYVTFNNNIIDLPHLAATVLGYTNSGSIVNVLVPDFWTGWGGDVATAMADVSAYKSGKKDTEIKYSDMDIEYIAENYVIGSSTSSCSEIDINADIDSLYFAKQFDKEGFAATFEDYYNKVTGLMRKSLVLTDLGDENTVTENELANQILELMTGDIGFGYIHEVAGLPLVQLATTNDGIQPTDEIEIDTCSAFAKYILNHYN